MNGSKWSSAYSLIYSFGNLDQNPRKRTERWSGGGGGTIEITERAKGSEEWKTQKKYTTSEEEMKETVQACVYMMLNFVEEISRQAADSALRQFTSL